MMNVIKSGTSSNFGVFDPVDVFDPLCERRIVKGSEQTFETMSTVVKASSQVKPALLIFGSSVLFHPKSTFFFVSVNDDAIILSKKVGVCARGFFTRSCKSVMVMASITDTTSFLKGERASTVRMDWL